MKHLVVVQNVLGGWDVRDADAGDAFLFRGARSVAESRAKELCAGTGGSITVLGPSGSKLAEYVVEGFKAAPSLRLPTGLTGAAGDSQRAVDTDSPVSESTLAMDLDSLLVKGAGLAVSGAAKAGVPGAETIRSEGKLINQGFGVLNVLLALGLFGTSISAQVISQGSTYIGVFFATLAWSGGVALTTYLAKTGVIVGAPLLYASVACFALAGVVAEYIGTGTLGVDGSAYSSAGERLTAYVTAAVTTYGLLGALISGFIAVWLGYRIAEATSDD